MHRTYWKLLYPQLQCIVGKGFRLTSGKGIEYRVESRRIPTLTLLLSSLVRLTPWQHQCATIEYYQPRKLTWASVSRICIVFVTMSWLIAHMVELNLQVNWYHKTQNSTLNYIVFLEWPTPALNWYSYQVWHWFPPRIQGQRQDFLWRRPNNSLLHASKCSIQSFISIYLAKSYSFSH